LIATKKTVDVVSPPTTREMVVTLRGSDFREGVAGSWKSGRHGLRGNEGDARARLRPAGYAAAAFATIGLAEPKLAQM
jgi:hypothetical protein